MDDVLLGIILRRLDAVPIGAEASDLLLAALDGSGKSSFAEGLEMLLTGSVRRWEKPAPAVTHDNWRNKHASDVVDVRPDCDRGTRASGGRPRLATRGGPGPVGVLAASPG